MVIMPSRTKCRRHYDAVRKQRPEFWNGVEPSGERRLGRRPCDRRYLMHEVGGDPEENRVTGTSIRDCAEDVRRFTTAQLKDTTVVRSRAEVDAHPDQSMAECIAVPRVVMAGAGHHAVDSAQEATDVAAPGELIYERKQPLVVSEKVQEIDRGVVLQAQLDADVIVSPLGEFGNLETIVNETQERRSEESLEPNAVLPIELRPETLEIRARGQSRPRASEMNHVGPLLEGIRFAHGPVRSMPSECRSDTVLKAVLGV
jgi:hypothetical protein